MKKDSKSILEHNSKIYFIFICVFVFSVAITGLPLYTMRFTSLDSSIKIMIAIEFIVALITYVFLFGNLSLERGAKQNYSKILASGITLSFIQIIYYLINFHQKNVITLDFLDILLLTILIPFYEEVYYRGCLFGFLCGIFSKNLFLPAILTSAVFSLMHTQYTSIIDHVVMFMISMILIYIRVITKGLFFSVILHSSMNAMALLLSMQDFFR